MHLQRLVDQLVPKSTFLFTFPGWVLRFLPQVCACLFSVVQSGLKLIWQQVMNMRELQLVANQHLLRNPPIELRAEQLVPLNPTEREVVG